MIIRRDAEALKPKKTNIIIQFLSRILKLVFNKIFYVAFSFIIQILWIGLLLARFIGYSRYISLGVEIISLIFVLRILNRKINPSYKLAWSVTIMCIPVFGLLFYLMFGKSRICRRMNRSGPDSWKKTAPCPGSPCISEKSQVILSTEILPRNTSRSEMTCSRSWYVNLQKQNIIFSSNTLSLMTE